MVSKLKKLLSKYRKFLFSDYRGHVLSSTICAEIEKLEKLKRKKVIKILDFGSGYDNIIINKIIKKLTYKYKKTKFLAYCYDFYTDKELKIMNINSNIKFYNINNLSSNKSTKFNFCLLIDVLHHIGFDNSKKIVKIVEKLKKNLNSLLLKIIFNTVFFQIWL